MARLSSPLRPEVNIVDEIIRDAENFRARIAIYCIPQSANITLELDKAQIGDLRFYLRKMMGARILLPEFSLLQKELERLSSSL